ncbi:hypothetical protein ACFQ9Z_13695 [Streptomyces sp. NPDC056580]|uniref:hypothetical protein n=1 Tax=Streptomyces sp. NPDC056580 TaxID=3345872 RepID=UPI0036CCAE43
MRFRTGLALVAATLLPVLAAPAADAATTPSVNFTFGKGARVDASSKVTINYSLANLPKGSHVELRRETGSSHTYKVINTLKPVNGNGSVTTKAPTQGRWGYRIFVLNSKDEVLTYRGHWLYAYSNISVSKFFPKKYSSGTIGVGNRLLAYDAKIPTNRAMDFFATTRNTTCRSITLGLGRINGFTGSRRVKVLQTNAPATSKLLPFDTYVSLSANLTGAPFALHFDEDPSNSADTYFGGTVNCYSASGF